MIKTKDKSKQTNTERHQLTTVDQVTEENKIQKSSKDNARRQTYLKCIIEKASCLYTWEYLQCWVF